MITILRFSAFINPSDSSLCAWLLWINEDGKGDGADRLFAGRVKLQDDPIATAEAVLSDAREKLQVALGIPDTLPLF